MLIKEAGFDGILLWWSNDFGRDAYGYDNYRKGPEMARKAGLFIENIHTPVQNQNDFWLDNLAGKELVDCYLHCVEDCDTFEIPTMVIHLPHDNYPHNALGLDRVKRIAEKAEQLDVNVAFENLWNINNLAYVLKQVDSIRVGFCYDSCHHYNNSSAGDLLYQYGSRLMALHLHDNGGSRSQHQLPFDGNLDWAVVMKKISEAKYSGPTALEPMNWDYMNLSADEFLIKIVIMKK